MKYFIGVASHKPYEMPASGIYFPIQVGARNNKPIEGFIRDDQGINISKDNPYFSELTALYYIWKNCDAQYKGLVHYRRYLGNPKVMFGSNAFERILNSDKLSLIFSDHDIILPKKRHYYIETNYSHYVHAHHKEALVYVQSILDQESVGYSDSFKKVLNRRSAHMFNMMIMSEQRFDEYCEWLFSILFKLRDELDISGYNTSEARVFGYVSELLLDVWIDANNFSYFEAPVVYIEGQHLSKKAFSFLKRKVFGSGNAHIHSSIDDREDRPE